MKTRTPLLLLAAALAGSAQAAVVFQDNFSGNSTANWSFSGPGASNWAAAGGKLQTATTQTTHAGVIGFATLNGYTTSSHFKLEADLQAVGPDPIRGSDFGHVGFFWGYTSSNDFTTSYLRVHSNQVTVWQNPWSSEELLSLGINTVNAATDLTGASYHLSLDVNYATQTLTMTLDTASRTLTGSAFTSTVAPGGVGGNLGMITWGERVSYDNVVLTDYTVADVPEPAMPALLAMGVAALLRRRRS